MVFLKKGSIKIIRNTASEIVEVVHSYIQNCSNKCSKRSTRRIDCLEYNFLQYTRIIVKSGGTKSPTVCHYPAKFGCLRFYGCADIKFLVFQMTTWSSDLVVSIYLT